jgi:DNA-binding MarR family transcriptional regulator
MKQLPEDYALVLQQINEDGGDDFDFLAESLRIDRRRLSHILQRLHNMGLVIMRRSTMTRHMWMSLSEKGQRFMYSLWPESAVMHG